MHDVERENAPPPREAPGRWSGRAPSAPKLLFVRLGAAVDVTVRETPEAVGVSLAPRDGNGVELSGTLVEAVQYLVNRVVNPRAEGRKWVNLEVGGFQEGGDPAVRAMALRLAEAALRTGKALAVSPMSARDRRRRAPGAPRGGRRLHAQRGRGDVPPATARHPGRSRSPRRPEASPPWRARRPGTRSSSPRRSCAARSSFPATSSGRGSSSSTTACFATWGSPTRTWSRSWLDTRSRWTPPSGGAAGRPGLA